MCYYDKVLEIKRLRWNVETAMEKIVEWSKVYLEGRDVVACMNQQIKEF